MGYPLPDVTTWGVSAVIAQLGQSTWPDSHRPTSTRWRLRHLAALIEGHGFPDPLPLPGAEPGKLNPRHRWLASSVRRWLDDRDPPGAAHADAVAARHGAEIMDQRAQLIGLRIHDGGRA